MISLDLNKIGKYLVSQGIEATFQKETDQLYILFKIGDREFPLFLRIYEGGELLQLLAFLPCNTKSTTLADTARLLHLLNKEIDVPGFGMDEGPQVIFYRCMIPAKDKQLDEKILDSYISATHTACQSFAPVIAAVAYGALTFEEVLRKSKDQTNQSFTQSHLKKE